MSHLLLCLHGSGCRRAKCHGTGRGLCWRLQRPAAKSACGRNLLGASGRPSAWPLGTATRHTRPSPCPWRKDLLPEPKPPAGDPPQGQVSTLDFILDRCCLLFLRNCCHPVHHSLGGSELTALLAASLNFVFVFPEFLSRSRTPQSRRTARRPRHTAQRSSGFGAPPPRFPWQPFPSSAVKELIAPERHKCEAQEDKAEGELIPPQLQTRSRALSSWAE